jgi:hypothetical protein
MPIDRDIRLLRETEPDLNTGSMMRFFIDQYQGVSDLRLIVEYYASADDAKNGRPQHRIKMQFHIDPWAYATAYGMSNSERITVELNPPAIPIDNPIQVLTQSYDIGFTAASALYEYRNDPNIPQILKKWIDHTYRYTPELAHLAWLDQDMLWRGFRTGIHERDMYK